MAVLYEQREIKYGELRALTTQAAEVLSALEIGKEDRVAILLADSPEFVASFVAIISLGALAVPINPALRREDQLFILKDCGARAAIVETKTAQPLFGNPESSHGLSELKRLVLMRRKDDEPGQAARLRQAQAVSLCDFDEAERRRLIRISRTCREMRTLNPLPSAPGEPKVQCTSGGHLLHERDLLPGSFEFTGGRSTVFLFPAAVCLRTRQCADFPSAQWGNDNSLPRETFS